MYPHNPYGAPLGAPPQPRVPRPGALSTGRYEFGPHEESTLRSTASRTRLWGIVSLVGGILGLLLTGLFAFGIFAVGLSTKLGPRAAVLSAAVFGFLAPIALVYTIVGKLYIYSGNALGKVAETRGDDVEHLMDALNQMANAFRIEAIMSVLAFMLGVVVAVLGHVGALVGAP